MLQDPWTQEQGWDLSEALQPPWRSALGDPDELLKLTATLGVFRGDIGGVPDSSEAGMLELGSAPHSSSNQCQ